MTSGSLTPEQARSEFPIFNDTIYLDVAARGPMANRVAERLRAYLDVCQAEAGRKQEWLGEMEQIRLKVARLLNASHAEIAFTKNTSDGLNVLAHSLAFPPGSNVVICPELEHGNNIYMWLHLRERGVEVRMVPAAGGAVDLSALQRAVDKKTRVVSLSSVSFISGAVADLNAVCEIGHQVGAFVLVDAVQGLGIVDMDMSQTPVDGLAAATQKGLLGLYGGGVLYCRKSWIDQLRPAFLSRMGVALDGHESDIGDFEHYLLRSDARRFELGNPNFASLFALDSALSLIDAVGKATIESHVRHLAGRLIEGLQTQCYTVITPPRAHAGIVSFQPDDLQRMQEELERRHIKASIRRGLVRVSLHVYSSDSDVACLLEATGAARTPGGSG